MEHDDDEYGAPPAGAGRSSDPDGGVAAEVMQRYGRSGQPDAQQVVAVLRATTEVIRAEGLPVGPTAYFAALMAALDKPETQASPQARRGTAAAGVASPAGGGRGGVQVDTVPW